MKQLFFILLFFIFLSNSVLASNCTAGNSAIMDFYDPVLGWIDTLPPNQECIRGIYGNETCTADPQCDGKDTNTYSCTGGVGVSWCDFNCVYNLLTNLCIVMCGANPICDGLAPGTEFADLTGDGTKDYCGGGSLNYSCLHIDTNICDSSFGASVDCDNEIQDVYFTNANGFLDYCDTQCQYFECLDGVPGMCDAAQVCQGNVCVSSDILLINGNESHTNSKFVMLNITFPSGLPNISCRFGNDLNELSHALWEVCLSTKAWELSIGDGEKTVFIEINTSGGVSQSNDTIILESLPYAVSIITPQSNSFLSNNMPVKIATSGAIYEVEYFITDVDNNQYDLSGVLGTSTVDTNPSDGWNQDWDLSSFTSGNYNLTVRVYDRCYFLFTCLVSEDTVSNLYYSSEYAYLSTPIVYDGIVGEDIDYINDNTSLAAHWDSMENIFFSNIFYKFKVYENGSCFSPYCLWSEIGNQESVIIPNLSLQEGFNYSFEVVSYTTNPYILSNSSFSDGVVIDLAKPFMLELNSSTHPNQTEFYANSNPIFEWSANDMVTNGTGGIEGYSIILNRINDTIPNEIVDTTDSSTEYFNLGDGTWYFHISPIDIAGNIGDAWHYKINIINDGVDVFFDSIYSPVEEPIINVTGYVTGVSDLELYINDLNVSNTSVTEDNLSNGKYFFEFMDVDILENATSSFYVKATTPNNFTTISSRYYVRHGDIDFDGDALYLKVEYDTGGRSPVYLDSGKLTYDSASDLIVGLASEEDNSNIDNATGGSDFVSIEANVRERPIYLFFTSPSEVDEIDSKDKYFENKDFVNLVNPTFSDLEFDEDRYFIGTELTYENIVLLGNRKLPVGRYMLIVENKGVDEYGNPIIDIRFE